MTQEDARLKIVENFKNEGCTSYQILIGISGKYLIENDLTEVWSISRNIKKEKITYEWTDYITLYQAKLIGLLDFAKSE